jgi:hypothetical protein
MGGNLVPLGGNSIAVNPLACQPEVMSGLAANMLIADMLLCRDSG